MVRNYKRTYTNARKGHSYLPYKSYTAQNLQDALTAVARGMSQKRAAELFKIPKSTIGRHVRGENKTYDQAGHPTLFTNTEEKTFVNHLQTVSEWGFPYTATDLRHIAKNYLEKVGRRVPYLKDNMPGYEWASNFLKRHKDKLRPRQAANISVNRSRINAEVIDSFFENLTTSISGVTADCFINFDETNVTDDPGSKKMIFKRGCKYPERILNATKTSISIMYAGTASGHILPPYVVYKADNLWNTWKEGGPPLARYNRSRSGWFDAVCFEDWFFSIILPYLRNKEGKKALIGDNLSSHFSQRVIEACEEMNIVFVCLPSNATHLLQPLDVAFFAPLKKYWREILTAYKKSTRLKGHLTKDSFPPLLRKLHEKLEENNRGAQNMIAGFRKTGLYPTDPNKAKERLPNTIQDEEVISSRVSDVLVDMLSDLRHETAGNIRRKRKKIYVEPGKSVCAEDFEPSTSASTSKAVNNTHSHSKGNVSDTSSNVSDDQISLHDETSDEETFSDFERDFGKAELDEENENDMNAENIKKNPSYCVGDWILVKYAGKKTIKYYVGCILEIINNRFEELQFKVKFLKKLQGKYCRYIENEDEDTVDLDMIVKHISPPNKKGSEKRFYFEFTEDLSSFNIF